MSVAASRQGSAKLIRVLSCTHLMIKQKSEVLKINKDKRVAGNSCGRAISRGRNDGDRVVMVGCSVATVSVLAQGETETVPLGSCLGPDDR